MMTSLKIENVFTNNNTLLFFSIKVLNLVTLASSDAQLIKLKIAIEPRRIGCYIIAFYLEQNSV